MITNTDRAQVSLLHLVVVVSGCPEAAGPADVELVVAGLCLEVGEEQEDPAARGHPAHTASVHLTFCVACTAVNENSNMETLAKYR